MCRRLGMRRRPLLLLTLMVVTYSKEAMVDTLRYGGSV